MVTLDQIRNLEAKVQRTVSYIAELKEENSLLQKNLEKYRERIDELEILINDYKEDQSEIERGIMNALSHLDKLEDDIARSPAPETEAGDDAVTVLDEEVAQEIDDVEGKVVFADEQDISEESSKQEGELDIF